MQDDRVEPLHVTFRHGVRRPLVALSELKLQFGDRGRNREKIRRFRPPMRLGILSTTREQSKRQESPDSLIIQSSQPTLIRIAKVLRARQEVPRSPNLLAKYNRHIRLPNVQTEPQDHETSFDSNELEVDLSGLLEGEIRRGAEIREMLAEEMIKPESESPLRQTMKRYETVSRSRPEALPKPPSRLSGEASLRSSQPHRFPIEQNAYLRIRWLQKQKSGLKRLIL